MELLEIKKIIILEREYTLDWINSTLDTSEENNRDPEYTAIETMQSEPHREKKLKKVSGLCGIISSALTYGQLKYEEKDYQIRNNGYTFSTLDKNHKTIDPRNSMNLNRKNIKNYEKSYTYERN